MTVGRGRVSNNVRHLREAAAMTQADLENAWAPRARRSSRSRRKKYAPSLELAFKLARTFHRPVDEVFQFHAQD